jgi:hypothetical protein
MATIPASHAILYAITHTRNRSVYAADPLVAASTAPLDTLMSLLCRLFVSYVVASFLDGYQLPLTSGPCLVPCLKGSTGTVWGQAINPYKVELK